MPCCAVDSCRNSNHKTKGTGIKYYRFPKNEDLAKRWINACNRGSEINLKYACVCSIHFGSDSYEIPLIQRLLNYNPRNSRNLKTDAVPILHLRGSPRKRRKTRRLDRIIKRMLRSVPINALNDTNYLNPRPSVCNDDLQLQPSTSNKEPQVSRHEPVMVDRIETAGDNVKAHTIIKNSNDYGCSSSTSDGVIAEQRASDVPCGIPPIQQSSQPLTIDVTVRIKQEPTEDHCLQCFGETCQDNRGNSDGLLTRAECRASLNRGLQPAFNGDEERSSVSTKTSTSSMVSAKNEQDRYGSESWSVFSQPVSLMLPSEVKREVESNVEVEDHVLCQFEAGLCKQEVYDEAYGQAELREDRACDVDDADESYIGTFVDVCNIKAERDVDLFEQAGRERGSPVKAFVCAKCNYSVAEKDRLQKHMKRHHNGTVQKHAKNQRRKNTKTQHSFVGDLYGCKYCDFTTKSKYYLITHVIVKHKSDAPVYGCANCSYATKWKTALSTHIRVHHKGYVRIHKCSRCNFVGKTEYRLRQHSKLKHNLNDKLYSV